MKRRLGVLGELIGEFGLKLIVVFVSDRNKTYVLTRLKKGLLRGAGRIEACRLNGSELRRLHAASYGRG